MRFEWDEVKNDTNLRERGFDFAFASLVFDGPTVEVEDRQRRTGETVRRIISVRRSNRHERKIYQAAHS